MVIFEKFASQVIFCPPPTDWSRGQLKICPYLSKFVHTRIHVSTSTYINLVQMKCTGDDYNKRWSVCF